MQKQTEHIHAEYNFDVQLSPNSEKEKYQWLYMLNDSNLLFMKMYEVFE
jgi:hypothetical protein